MPLNTNQFFDRLKSIQKNLVKEDQDAIWLIDGEERIGKSSLAIEIGTALQGFDKTLEHMIFTKLDFIEFCEKLTEYPPGTVHILDEAQNILSRRDNTKFTRYAEEILKSMGCYSQILIACSPRCFELNHVLLERADMLLHCYSRGFAKAWTQHDAQTLLSCLVRARRSGELTKFEQISKVLKKKGLRPTIFAELSFEGMPEDVREQYNMEKKERIGQMARDHAKELRKGLKLDDGQHDDGENGTNNERYLTVAEVADRLGYKKSYVYKLIEDGRLSKVKLFGKSVRVPESDIEKIIVDS